MYVALQCAASFHCLVEEWKDCEELNSTPKAKWSFIDKSSEGLKHRVRGSKQVSMFEVRNLGGHDLVRRMDRKGEAKKLCRKCLGYARQRMGPKLVKCCGLEQMSTKEFGKMIKESRLSKKEESQPKRQRIGESREKRKELRERSKTILKWKAQWHKKTCGIWQKRKTWKEERCPRKKVTR